MTDVASREVLDNPALASLLGPHAHLAIRRGQVLRYPGDVAPFIALPDDPDEQTWRDAADLLGPGAILPLAGLEDAGTRILDRLLRTC